MNKKIATFLGLLLLGGIASLILASSMGKANSPIAVTTTNQLKHGANTIVTTGNRRTKQNPHLACEPYGSHTAEIIGSATDSNEQEHVLWKYTRNPPSGHTDAHDHFFIKVTTLLGGSVCGASYEPTADEAITDRIELDTARSLYLQLYQHLISEAGNQETFQQEFLENLEERNLDPFSQPTFTSVEVWVWNELGIDVPENQYVVQNIDDNYKYDENGQVGF